MPNPAISPKRAAFVREYVKDFNATAAALRAGYSARTAKSQGARLLTFVDIQSEIARLQHAATTDAVMTLAEACGRMSEIARDHDDETSIKAVARLAKMLGWDTPTKVAPTTPDGTEPYQPVMSPEEAAAMYMEAMQRAVSRD